MMCCFLFWIGVDSVFAQKVVSGQVTDAGTDEPLPGVNILIKDAAGQGTVTDLDGQYTITVPDNQAVLLFSFIGYQSEEVPVGTKNTINVSLVQDIASLDEVVVIGYGTVKRRDLTGSVASIKAEEIMQTPTHNAIEAVMGRVPGIDIVRSSGEAGAGTNVLIRGQRSIFGSSSPLYIIDGFQGGSIADLNPNDIASIDVLKDASATAIYGSQGANGVIIVTTKRGKVGKPKVSYNGYYGINGLTPFPERLMGEEYVNVRREAWRTAGRWEDESDDQKLFAEDEWNAYQAGEWVDWVDELMRNGSQQSHTVTVNGGSENTKVFASGGYFKEEGMYRLNDYTRYNARFNLDQNFSSWAKAGFLSQIAYHDLNRRRDPLGDAISAVPLGQPYNEFGEININPVAGNPSVVSPLADELPNAAVDNENNISVNINAFVEITPLKGLSIRSNFGSRLNGGRRGQYYSANSYTRRNQRNSMAAVSSFFNRFYHWDNIINYSREIGDHSFTLTGITNFTEGINDNAYASGMNQLLPSNLYYNLGATDPESRAISSGYVGSKTMSYAARINYSFKGKYLLTLTNRIDGASRLAPGNQWDAFPSIAAAWNIDQESFMQNINNVSQLKIRASYGIAGNSGINEYGTQSLIYPRTNLGFGDVPAPYYQFAGRVGNPNLGWEKSATTNVGLDLGFFQNRINATIDAYNTETTDILFVRNLPQSTGVAEVWQNVASTRNRGIELSLNTVNVDTRDFRWNSTLTFTRNREEITGLIDTSDIIQQENNSLLIGHPINSFYTYKKLGIWQLEEGDEAAELLFGSETGPPFAPGDIKLEDVNGDGIINPDNDRQYVGSSVPKWVAGLRNHFRYKAFDLDIFLFARWGQTINAEFLGRYNPEGTGGSLALFDYWTPENPSNDFPRPRRGPIHNIFGYQSLTYVDGSYFKIRNIQLGYNMPNRWSEKIGIHNIRFYATGGNLLVLTKSPLLKNYDPEGGGSESYPINRQVVFGVNIDF